MVVTPDSNMSPTEFYSLEVLGDVLRVEFYNLQAPGITEPMPPTTSWVEASAIRTVILVPIGTDEEVASATNVVKRSFRLDS